MSEKDGVSHIDYAHFNEVEPLEPMTPPVPAAAIDPRAVPGA
jgi:inward rectifier potassium channel